MRTIYVRKGNYGFSTHLKNSYKGQECDMWMDVKFGKNNTPEDSCKIEILDDFMSCYLSKNGTKPKWIITNYRIVEEDKPKEEKTSTDIYFDDIKVDDEFENSSLELPF